MLRMSASKAYNIGAGRLGASDISDATVRAIRSACIAKGTSLHAWATAWAHSHGRDAHATYVLTLTTIRRTVAVGKVPKGDLGKQIVNDLWAYLYGAAADMERAA